MNHLTDEQLNEYLDDMLAEAEKTAVEAHLHQCESCRAQLQALQVVFAALNEVAAVVLPVDVETAVLQNLPASTATPAWVWALITLELAAAAAMTWVLRPTAQTWLAAMRQQAQSFITSWQIPSLSNTWQTVTAVFQRLPAPPTLTLPAIQWAVLIGLAFTGWLLANRILLQENLHEMSDD
ncbi:MAG: hypothetical protein Kow0080_23950 [Candidatus Promineifilaceae bacterium]